MPRCKTLRWPLAAPVLVALAVAGCGAAGDQQRLHSRSEKRLLSLVSRARADASAHNGAAVHAVLGEFVSEVGTLRASGQLSNATATQLDREARTTAAQAAQRLHPVVKTASTMHAPATTTTTPRTDPAPTPPAASGKGNGRQPTPAPANPGTSGAQGGSCSDSNWPGQGPGHGHGHAGQPGCGQGDGGGQDGTASAWVKAWSYWTGGGRD